MSEKGDWRYPRAFDDAKHLQDRKDFIKAYKNLKGEGYTLMAGPGHHKAYEKAPLVAKKYSALHNKPYKAHNLQKVKGRPSGNIEAHGTKDMASRKTFGIKPVNSRFRKQESALKKNSESMTGKSALQQGKKAGPSRSSPPSQGGTGKTNHSQNSGKGSQKR